MTMDKSTIELLAEPVLCYVEKNWAYFTNLPLEYQIGDDWDDAPYEHNAGEPYPWREGYSDEPKYTIIKLAFSAPMIEPSEHLFNSPYSVDAINRGDIAWLRPEYAPPAAKPIPAGTTVSEFVRLIKLADGEVYLGANSLTDEELHSWLARQRENEEAQS